MSSEIAARVEDAHAAKRRETSSQDELIARAAHELRGPLGSIANWVHLLSQAKQDTALQQQGLAAMQRALQLSGRLIDELSDVALLRAGRVRLRSGLVDLVAIVEMAIDKPRSTAREKGVSLELARELASVPVLGDPDRLQQIVLHLVGNAVKFTPAGGRVDVTIDRDGTSWRLAVSDSGTGPRSRAFAPPVRRPALRRFRHAARARQPRSRAGNRSPSGRAPRRQRRGGEPRSRVRRALHGTAAGAGPRALEPRRRVVVQGRCGSAGRRLPRHRQAQGHPAATPTSAARLSAVTSRGSPTARGASRAP